MREHGTKTTLIFLPADGESSWSLLPSLVVTCFPFLAFFMVAHVVNIKLDFMDYFFFCNLVMLAK